jgi:hypothetical protein
MHVRTRAAIGAAAVAVLIGIAGCTTSANNASMSSEAAATTAAGGSADQAGAAAPTNAGGAAGPAGKEPGLTATQLGQDSRSVIRTATATLTVSAQSAGKGDADDDRLLTRAVADATVRVQALAGGQGYVAAVDSSGGTSSVTLRVPANGYAAVIDALPGIGAVDSLKEQAQDVTAQLADVAGRVDTLRAGVAAVRALLTKADKIADVIALESELTTREADLESLLRQQAALSDQVALSTVTVVVQGSLLPVGTAPATEPAPQNGFAKGLHAGWTGLTHFLSGAATVLGGVLPFLPVVLVVGVAVLLVRRWNRQRRPAEPHPDSD